MTVAVETAKGVVRRVVAAAMVREAEETEAARVVADSVMVGWAVAGRAEVVSVAAGSAAAC